MPAQIDHFGEQPLPGPGIYRLEGRASDICISLVNLADMVRQFLPAINPERYPTGPGRSFVAESVLGGFLSADEIRQVNRFKALKKQVEWIGGRYAVKTVLAKTLPAAGPPVRIQVAHEPRGAPYPVGQPGISISISHAGDYALAGVSPNTDTRIGLDIERIGRRGMEDVMRVAFTDREIALAGGSPEEICRVWTRKEAYLKFIKTGFRENLKRVDVSGGAIIHGGVPVAGLHTKTLPVGKRYLVSLVYQRGRQG